MTGRQSDPARYENSQVESETTNRPARECANAAPAVGVQHSTRYVWYVIFLLFVVNVFNYMDRMALSVLTPSIKLDLHLSDAQLGLLTGLAFALFYAVCGIPMARWADRGTRRNIIAIALTTWSVMTALGGFAQNFWQLFLARVGIGVGESGCLPTAQSVLCDYVQPKRRPGVFAIHTFGLYGGMVVGMAFAGWFGATLGWRWTFVVLGLPGIALAVIVRLTLREPVRGSLDRASVEQGGTSFRGTIATLLRCRTYRLLVLYVVVDNFVQYGLNQWWPSFYVRVFGLDLSVVGPYLGLAIAAGAGTGLLVGGFVANKVAQRDVRLPLIISAASISLGLPTALASLFVSSAYSSMALVSLTALFWSASSGPVVATLYGVTAPRMRATAGALSTFSISVLGFGLGPLCVGLLSDALTPSLGTEALRYALLLPVCLHPLTIVVLCAAAKGLPRDLNAAVAQNGGAEQTNLPARVTAVVG